MRAEGSGVRVVIPRFGIVLASDGGALQRMMVPFRFFVGGYLGKGTQWLPWMHRDDAVQALMHLVTTRDISGPVNFVAPQAVTMREFCRELGRAMGRPSWTYIPPFALRILLGELADVLLGGQQAPPEKLIESGYTFAYPNLGEALTSLNLR
jgi:hypothetical protein